MTIQEVILMAMAKKLTWIEASRVLGYTDRHMRRVKARYEREGFHGLYDGRSGRLSPRRISSEVVEEVLRLYRDEYFDFNVVHFHEKLVERHEFSAAGDINLRNLRKEKNQNRTFICYRYRTSSFAINSLGMTRSSQYWADVNVQALERQASKLKCL